MGQQAGRAIGRMVLYGPEGPIPGVFLECCGRTVADRSEGHAAWCSARQAEAERDAQRRLGLPVLFEREIGGAQAGPTPLNRITPPRAMTQGERDEKKRAATADVRARLMAKLGIQSEATVQPASTSDQVPATARIGWKEYWAAHIARGESAYA